MKQYIAKRLLLVIPVTIGVSLVVFSLVRLAPSDVALTIAGAEEGRVSEEELQEIRRALGIDQPFHIQYFTWMGNLVRGDAGKSFLTEEPVIGEIAARLAVSVEMTVLTLFMSVLIGMPLGIICAIRRNTWMDYVFRVISILGLAMPDFWTALLILLTLIAVFGWMPPLAYVPLWEDPLHNLSVIVWPTLALGYMMAAVISRMTRSCMLEVLGEDYIRTAWAKGLREPAVILRHALRNAILPVITIIGVRVGTVMGGVVIMEQVFSVPGLGRYLVRAIFYHDYPSVQAVILLIGVVYVFLNLTIDLLYAWLDPRIRYS